MKAVRTIPFFRISLVSFLSALSLSIYQSLVVNQGTVEEIKELFFLTKNILIITFLTVFVGLIILYILGTDFLFRRRYYIALIIFFICVTLEINGSSIGLFATYFGEADTDILMGVSRAARSDEWATTTPAIWSQYYNTLGHFSYYNSVVRADYTDVFLVYGLPVRSWLIVFKPFLLGYLFLPVAKGMSFYWCGRFIALFLVSFEFGRFITDDDRRLAVVYAVLITLSPCIQWWYAAGGLVEMVICFQLSLMSLDRFLINSNHLKRLCYLLVIILCAGGYIFTMYPAWMIPLVYVLLGCILWVVKRRLDEKTIARIKAVDVLSMVGTFSILFIALLFVAYNSQDAIISMTTTLYPGDRISSGGLPLEFLLQYISNLWYAVRDSAPVVNPCELSYFFCLFPMGYIIYLRYCLLSRNFDILSNILCVISAFLLVYIVVGMPNILLSVTFLGRSTANRALVIFGFANIILLIRGIHLLKLAKRKNRYSFSIIALLCGLSIISVWITYKADPAYYSKAMLGVEIVILTILFIGGFYANEKKIEKTWCVLIAFISIFSTGLVNPIRMGVEDVENIPELLMVEKIVEQKPESIWVVEGVGYPITDAIIMKGAKTINSTNIYPDLDRWKQIDPESEYEYCYNRFAHIYIEYSEESTEKFELLNPDYFHVNLSYEELKELGVDYLFTPHDFTMDPKVTLIDMVSGYSVYALK